MQNRLREKKPKNPGIFSGTENAKAEVFILHKTENAIGFSESYKHFQHSFQHRCSACKIKIKYKKLQKKEIPEMEFRLSEKYDDGLHNNKNSTKSNEIARSGKEMTEKNDKSCKRRKCREGALFIWRGLEYNSDAIWMQLCCKLQTI